MGKLSFIWNETIGLIRHHPLSRGKAWSRIGRYLRWQLSSRIWAGGRVVDLTDRSQMIVQRGMHGATGNVYLGLHEVADMGLALHLLRPEDEFVDVGANIGVYTLLASGHVGCRSTTIEPAPITFDRLRTNVLLNDLLDKVRLIQCGVGEKPSTAKITVDADAMNHVVSENESVGQTAEISIRTLDDICQDISPRLIKIDVEGFETAVIAGGHQTLSNKHLQAILIELNGFGERYGHDESRVAETIIDYGFRPAEYDPIKRTLRLVDDVNYSMNSLFVRDFEWAQNRVQSSPMVTGWWGSI